MLSIEVHKRITAVLRFLSQELHAGFVTIGRSTSAAIGFSRLNQRLKAAYRRQMSEWHEKCMN
jgi:hypothetical protein